MTSAPFLPPLSAADALGFRGRRLGATATAVSVPPSSPGLRPGSVACLTSAFFFTASFLAATRQSFVKRHECASLPSRTRLRKPDDLVRHLRRQFPLRLDLRVRALIELLAQVETERKLPPQVARSEEHTSELQSPCNLVCRLLL